MSDEIKDPFDDAPEVTVYGSLMEQAARALADQVIYIPELNPKTVRIHGTPYICHSQAQAREIMIATRFRLVRSLVTFARMQTAQVSARAMADAFGGAA